jgi:hypothetical protein
MHRLYPRKVKPNAAMFRCVKQCLNGSLPLREHLFRVGKAEEKFAGVV